MTTGKYRGSTTFLLVYSELIRAAQFRGTMTYQEIALMMGLPLSGNHMGAEVGKMLGEIAEDEHNHGRPLLSAIVVNTNGKPSEGFYTIARNLGLLSENSVDSRQAFLEAQRKAVYSAWKKDLPKA